MADNLGRTIDFETVRLSANPKLPIGGLGEGVAGYLFGGRGACQRGRLLRCAIGGLVSIAKMRQTQPVRNGHRYSEAEREAIIENVLAQLSAGVALYRILRDDDAMPSEQGWWKWVWRDDELGEKVQRARELGIEARLAQCDAIADGDEIDEIEGKTGGDLARAIAKSDPKRARLRVETRMKMAAMLKPKKYGAKIDVTTDGGALNKPAQDDAERAHALLRQVETRLHQTPASEAVIGQTVIDLLS